MSNPFDLAEQERTSVPAANPFDAAEQEWSGSPSEPKPGKLAGAWGALKRGIIAAQAIPDTVLAVGSAGLSKPTVRAERKAFEAAMSDPRYMSDLATADGNPQLTQRIESLRGPQAKLSVAMTNPRAIEQVNVQALAEQQQRAAAIPRTAAQEELAGAATSADKWQAWLENPVELTTSIVLESLPPSLAGAGLGMVAGPAGMAGGVGSMSALTTFSSELLASAQQQGVDIANPAELQEFLDNEQLFRPAFQAALTKSALVGGVDAMTAQTAGRFIEPALKQGLKQRVIATGKELAVQAGGGAGGEFLGQVATGQKLDPFDIAMEAVAEVASAPGEIYGNLRGKKQAASSQPGAKPEGQTRPGVPPEGATPASANPFDDAEAELTGKTPDQVRLELAALPGAEQDLAEGARTEDRGANAAPVEQKIKDLTAAVAGLEAAIKGNQLAPQQDAPKPSQTITGSNVQTGTEMPVQPQPASVGGRAVGEANLPAAQLTTPNAESAVPTVAPAQAPPAEATASTIPSAKPKKRRKMGDVMNQPPPGGWTEADKVPAEYRKSKVENVEVLPKVPDTITVKTPNGNRIVRIGARHVDMNPANPVEIDKITMFDPATGSKEVFPAPEQQTQIKQRAAEFRQLVEDYAPQLEWTPAEAYDESFGADTKDVGFRKAELRTNAIRQAMRAVFPNGQENSQVDQANALPKLEAYLRQQFPGDNSIAKRRVLEDFGRSEANPQETATVERDQAMLDQLAARYTGKAFLQGLRAIGRRTTRGPGKLDAQPGGKSSGKGALPAAGASAVTELERIFGVRVIFVQDATFAGVKPAGVKLILINTKARAPMMALAGHELLHHIASVHPGLYADFKREAFALLKNSAQFRAQLERNGYDNLTDDLVTEEMFADVLGDAVLDPVFLQQLAKAEPNLFKRFARTAAAWLEKLIAKAKALTGFDSAQYVTDLTEMRHQLLNLLRDAGRATQFERAGIEADAGQSPEQGQDAFSRRKDASARRANIVSKAEKDFEAATAKNKAIVDHQPKDPDDEYGLESWSVYSKEQGNDHVATIFKSEDGEFDVTDKDGNSLGWRRDTKDFQRALSDAKDYVEAGGTQEQYNLNAEARSEILHTLDLPPDFRIKDIQDTKWGSVYYLLEKKTGVDEDGEWETESYKVSIRNHEPSPFREKEFGANDAYYEVPKEATPQDLSDAVAKVERFAWRRSENALESGASGSTSRLDGQLNDANQSSSLTDSQRDKAVVGKESRMVKSGDNSPQNTAAAKSGSLRSGQDVSEGGDRFSMEGGDLFGAPESVEEQRARLKREAAAKKIEDGRSKMAEKQAARLIGKDLDTTKEMFGAEVKTDKSGQQDMFSREGERNLVAVHNTRADGLMHAMKMGGLAVPSIAIVRADRAVLEGFGDITLVGTPELVTPSKDTKVLNADAYSPRYPKVDIIINYGDAKKVTAAFQKYRDEVPARAGDYEWQASQVTDKITERGWRELQYSSLARYAFLRDKGLIESPAAGTDIETLRREVDRRTKGLEGEIAAWAELKVKNLVPVSEKIFKGFNNSGNRSYTPHTLENVVKIMKKGFADAEGFNYGVGSVRAKTGKQFRSLEGIQKDRDKIIPKAQMDALKAEVDKEFIELHDYAMTYRDGGKNSGFGTLDAFSDDLKAMAEGGSANMQHLREMYPSGEPFAKMRAFLDKLRDLPTEYFEAKPRRAVQLQEFSGAAVPEGTSPELIAALEKRGLTVRTYPKGNPEARRAAVAAIANERGDMFSRERADSDMERLQAEIAQAEKELMAAIRLTTLPADMRSISKKDALAAKDGAAAKLHRLLAQQLKLMTSANVDTARSPEQTAELISQTVDLLNSIQDEISARTAKSQEIPSDLIKLRQDLQTRLNLLKGWTDQQTEQELGIKSERPERTGTPRDARMIELESATDPERQTWGEWWQKLKLGLRYLTSPIPELPLTGERAQKSALFRRGYRLFAVENDRVQKEAAEKVQHVLDPLTKLGRDPQDNAALKQYFKLGEALQRAKMDAGRTKAIRAKMTELEARLNRDPFNLFRRLVLYRDMWWRGTYLKTEEGKPITLPMGLTVDEVRAELRRLTDAISQHKDGLAITEALRRHYALTDDLQKSILAHGEIIPESLRNPLYFPHHIIDSWNGRIDRVKPTTEEDFRKYLITPQGSGKLIQSDYLKAMYLHTASVLAHNSRVDLVDKYWKPYDISEKLKAQHGAAWNKPWNMPAGYKLFAPYKKLPLRMDYVLSREVLADKLGVLFNDGDLRERMGEVGKVLKVKPEDLHAALVQGEKIQWALPEEIADALHGIVERETKGWRFGDTVGLPLRKLNSFWKGTKLFAPWNWIRYEYGNLSTDAIDKVLAADPGAAKYLGRAAREVWASGDKDFKPSPEFAAAQREGVFDTVTAGEAGKLLELPAFKEFLTPGEKKLETVKRILGGPARGSKFREATFRYANFLGNLERLRAGKEPVYAGAFHGDIEALGEDVDGQRRMLEGEELNYAKAAEISLKTFGDYNSLGVASQWLRKYAVPFWSWQDVNFRYHANQLRNLADGLAGKSGDVGTARKAALRYAGIRVVSTLVAVGIAKELWNQFGGPALGLWDDDDDLESKLSAADRRRGHILLGKDDKGQAMVVYTPSAWSDIAEWMGGQNMKRLLLEWARGQITLDQVVTDYAKQLGPDTLNKLFGSFGPLFKGPYETISGKATFPDITDQRRIPQSEKWWRLVGTMTDDRIVNSLRAAFDKDFYSQPAAEQLQQIILQVRRRDPEQWAYFEVREDASDWKETKTGKRFEGGAYDAPEAMALRNFRKAIYRGDVANALRFYDRLLEYGYTAERLDASIRAQHPLADLNEFERKEYTKTLSAKQRRELELATKYYNRIKALDGRERQLFPSKGQKPSPRPELLKRIVGEQSK